MEHPQIVWFANKHKEKYAFRGMRQVSKHEAEVGQTTKNKVVCHNIHKKLLFITLPLLLCERLMEAGPGDPARVAPSSPRCSCSCCCRKPDAKGKTNKQSVDSELVNKATSQKSNIRMSDYLER
jgi:hypothetical protein